MENATVQAQPLNLIKVEYTDSKGQTTVRTGFAEVLKKSKTGYNLLFRCNLRSDFRSFKIDNIGWVEVLDPNNRTGKIRGEKILDLLKNIAIYE